MNKERKKETDRKAIVIEKEEIPEERGKTEKKGMENKSSKEKRKYEGRR